MEKPDVVSMVRREMKKRGLSEAYLARHLRLNSSTVHTMLKRQTMQVNRLIEFSELFQYNIFREVAEKLPIATPDYRDSSEAEALRKRVSELELEVQVLRQTFRDLGISLLQVKSPGV